MAQFQAKTGWKRLKKGENKNYRFVSFLHDAKEIIQKKNSKKILKIKQPYYGFFSGQNRLEKVHNERKQKLSFRFVPTQRIIENSKKIAK